MKDPAAIRGVSEGVFWRGRAHDGYSVSGINNGVVEQVVCFRAFWKCADGIYAVELEHL